MAVAVIPNVSRRWVTDPGTGESREYFTGTLPSDKAKALTFVPVLEASKKTYLREDVQDGYQQPGSAVRMQRFAEYVRDNPLSVVPPVMLSGRGQWRFVEESSLLEVEAPAAIMDGQHRVGGYWCLFEKDGQPRPIEFFLLPDLELDKEKAEFRTINGTQTGVPKSSNILLESSENAFVAEELRTRKDSPFHDRITRGQRRPGDLFTLAAVERNVGRTFSHGAFSRLGLHDKVEILLRYWDIIADQFPVEWGDIDRPARGQKFKLLETTGLIAWSLAAEEVLGRAFDSAARIMNWNKVKVSVERLATPGALDWGKDGEFQGLTGEVGGGRIHRKMQAILAQASSYREDEAAEDT